MSEKAARLELVDGGKVADLGASDAKQRRDHRLAGQDRRSHGRRLAEGERQLEERVIALCSGAIDSRSVAARYIESASVSLARARAGRDVDGGQRANHLDEADRAGRQARKCLRFAQLCERRASALATELDPARPAVPDATAR